MGLFDRGSSPKNERRRAQARLRRSQALLESEQERLLADERLHEYSSQDNLLTKPFARLSDAVEGRIPPGLGATLDNLFYQAFRVLFERGTPVIERSYSARDLSEDHHYRRLVYRKKPSARALRAIDRRASGIVAGGTAFTTLEGVVLGAFGWGLPDIPVFISVLLRQLYRIARSYGFPCESDRERAYLLTLIVTALSQGEERQQSNRHLDWVGERIDTGQDFSPELDAKMHAAAAALSKAMLAAKFVQGTMIVGALGGVMNLAYFKQIAAFAKVKYKRRFLLEEQRRLALERDTLE